MLWTIFVVLVILWLLGFGFHVGISSQWIVGIGWHCCSSNKDFNSLFASAVSSLPFAD
jgi:hypothetical protein